LTRARTNPAQRAPTPLRDPPPRFFFRLCESPRSLRLCVIISHPK
jgi:hypothetical protein